MVKRRSGDDSLGLYLTQKVGFIGAMRVCMFLVEWGEYVAADPDPTITRFAEFGSSPATMYRTLKLFRKAFPAEKTPQRIYESVAWRVEQVDKGRSAVSRAALFSICEDDWPAVAEGSAGKVRRRRRVTS